MDIETMATSAVVNEIAKTDLLTPYVNNKDKEPFWDGFIYAYRHPSKTNKFCNERVPVQVKGKVCNDFSKKNITFRIKNENLEIYRKDGGILYFVVYISDNGDTKIYYASLLPYEINRILKKKKKDETPVTLHEFTADKQEFVNLVFNFISDREKQKLLRSGKDLSLDDFIKEIGSENLTYGFSYTGFGYDRDNPFEYLFNHDYYLYAQNKNLNIHIPVGHVVKTDMAKFQASGNVCIDGKEYYNSYDIVHKPEGVELRIGKSLVIHLSDEDYSSATFKICGNLDETIIALDLIIQIFVKKYVTIEGFKLDVYPTEQEIKEFRLKDKIEYLNKLKKIQEVLRKLDVTVPLELDGLTEKSEDYINMLIVTVKHGNTIRFKSETIEKIANLRINNLKIMLHFIENEDGKYSIENFNDSFISCTSEYADGTKFPTSKFILLKEKDYVTVSNLNFSKLIKDIKQFENNGHYQYTNAIILEMLKAYDKNNNEELLNAAIQIAEWLVEKNEGEDLYILNLFQCYARNRDLEESEFSILLDIIERQRNNAMVVGAYILLGNEKLAERYFNRLSCEEQDEFIKYPIYELWKRN